MPRRAPRATTTAIIRSKSRRTCASTRAAAAAGVRPNRHHSRGSRPPPRSAPAPRPATSSGAPVHTGAASPAVKVMTLEQQNTAKGKQLPLDATPPRPESLPETRSACRCRQLAAGCGAVRRRRHARSCCWLCRSWGVSFLVVLLLGANVEDVMAGDMQRDHRRRLQRARARIPPALVAFAASFLARAAGRFRLDLRRQRRNGRDSGGSGGARRARSNARRFGSPPSDARPERTSSRSSTAAASCGGATSSSGRACCSSIRRPPPLPGIPGRRLRVARAASASCSDGPFAACLALERRSSSGSRL